MKGRRHRRCEGAGKPRPDGRPLAAAQHRTAQHRTAQRSAHLLVVDTHTSGSFMRANVSRGPPRQAAHEGAAGGTQPASAKISAAVLPPQPGTGRAYTSAHTCGKKGRAGQGAGGPSRQRRVAGLPAACVPFGDLSPDSLAEAVPLHPHPP